MKEKWNKDEEINQLKLELKDQKHKIKMCFQEKLELEN